MDRTTLHNKRNEIIRIDDEISSIADSLEKDEDCFSEILILIYRSLNSIRIAKEKIEEKIKAKRT